MIDGVCFTDGDSQDKAHHQKRPHVDPVNTSHQRSYRPVIQYQNVAIKLQSRLSILTHDRRNDAQGQQETQDGQHQRY